MQQIDSYLTIKKHSEGFFKDRGSKFFAYAIPCENEDELKIKINALKEQHHSARHCCYAYRFKPDYSVYRVNDDGEPTNAAGKPILGQIDAKNLINTALIVVRYFGGTKLGVGGMMNAYKEAALNALNCAQIIECTIDDTFHVQCGYPEINTVMRFIKDLRVTIIEQKLEIGCDFFFTSRQKNTQIVLEKFKGLKNIHIKKLP